MRFWVMLIFLFASVAICESGVIRDRLRKYHFFQLLFPRPKIDVFLNNRTSKGKRPTAPKSGDSGVTQLQLERGQRHSVQGAMTTNTESQQQHISEANQPPQASSSRTTQSPSRVANTRSPLGITEAMVSMRDRTNEWHETAYCTFISSNRVITLHWIGMKLLTSNMRIDVHGSPDHYLNVSELFRGPDVQYTYALLTVDTTSLPPNMKIAPVQLWPERDQIPSDGYILDDSYSGGVKIETFDYETQPVLQITSDHAVANLKVGKALACKGSAPDGGKLEFIVGLYWMTLEDGPVIYYIVNTAAEKNAVKFLPDYASIEEIPTGDDSGANRSSLPRDKGHKTVDKGKARASY